MSGVLIEQTAHYLHRHIPPQGFKLLYGNNAGAVGRRLVELGHSVICLSEPGDAVADSLHTCVGLRVVKGSLLNIPYNDFLQSIIILEAFDRVSPFHWHALPEVFARALRSGGTVFLGALREAGRFVHFKDIDRLMRESGFIRTHQTELHFDIPDLEDMLGAWWEKWEPVEPKDSTTNLF